MSRRLREEARDLSAQAERRGWKLGVKETRRLLALVVELSLLVSEMDQGRKQLTSPPD